MKILCTKRLDHFGLVMGLMRELGLIDLIDKRIGEQKKNKVSAREAVAAMWPRICEPASVFDASIF